MANNVKMVFDNQFHGIITGHHGSSQVGPAEGALAAYDMVLGGLGACLNHTFQTILDKKKVSVHAINYDIHGEKREEVPTTLNLVKMDVKITGADESDHKKIEKSFKLATEYCSVYQTLSHVAKMEYTITYS